MKKIKNDFNLDSPTIHNLRSRKILSTTEVSSNSSSSYSSMTLTNITNSNSTTNTTVTTSTNSNSNFSFESNSNKNLVNVSSNASVVDSVVESACSIHNLNDDFEDNDDDEQVENRDDHSIGSEDDSQSNEDEDDEFYHETDLRLVVTNDILVNEQDKSQNENLLIIGNLYNL